MFTARAQYSLGTRRSTRSPRPPLSPRAGRAERRSIALSQNFLRNRVIAEAILDRSTIGPEDVVYEIGPGEGTITQALAARCGHVVAVEKDPALAMGLRRRCAALPNVTVFLADCLDFPLPVTRYKVFANVPFNVTAAIVARLTGAAHAPEDAYLAVQHEAALRYTGMPSEQGALGTQAVKRAGRGPENAPETLVSVLLKPWFEPSIVHQFSRRDFVPQPGVDVVLLRLRKRGPPLLRPHEVSVFRDMVTHGFTAWQPSLRRAFAGIVSARTEACLRNSTGLDLDVRPSALPFESWLALFRCIQEDGGRAALARLTGSAAHLRDQQAALQKSHRTRPPPR